MNPLCRVGNPAGSSLGVDGHWKMRDESSDGVGVLGRPPVGELEIVRSLRRLSCSTNARIAAKLWAMAVSPCGHGGHCRSGATSPDPRNPVGTRVSARSSGSPSRWPDELEVVLDTSLAAAAHLLHGGQ